jgi:hypothetical protein
MFVSVKSAHLNSTGFAVLGRNRIKGFLYTASSTAGTVNIFDTVGAPVTSGTYARAATTGLVTVTSTTHGLKTDQLIGITFATATGVSATNGNYIITVVDANTFTFTDINTTAIAASTACTYTATGRWAMSFDTAGLTTSGVPQNGSMLIPNAGIIVDHSIYIQMTNQTGFTVFYG